MSVRQKIIKDLTPRVGFAFSESDLSPSVRKKIGDMEATYQELDAKAVEYSRIAQRTSTSRSTAIVLSIIGVFFALLGILAWPLAIIGIILFAAAFMSIFIAWKNGSEIAKTKETVMSTLVRVVRIRQDALAKTIYDELSTVYAARTNTQVSPMIKETTIVKEVVMIPCDHCRGLMPQTSLFCPNCAARRKGDRRNTNSRRR